MESKSNRHSLCVIIPMYNEEKGAAVCVGEVEKVLRKLTIKSALIICNDGSTDKTFDILKAKKNIYKNRLLIVSSSKNQGYGKAIQNGINVGIKQGFTFGIFMDSDLTNNPKFIANFAQYVDKDYDCIKASRYISGGNVIGVPLYRRVISILGNKFASFCFRVGIKDCTNGFRMVRLALLRSAFYKETGFAIILEEMYILKRMKAKFLEIPTTLTARKTTKSHFSYTLQTYWSYVQYPLKAFLHI